MLRVKDFSLVNVHVPYEGEIAKTDLLIPYDRIGRNLEKFPADKGAKVGLYCRSGSMSAIAARKVVQESYTNVWNLDGEMIAWREAGHPLVHKKRQSTRSQPHTSQRPVSDDSANVQPGGLPLRTARNHA